MPLSVGRVSRRKICGGHPDPVHGPGRRIGTIANQGKAKVSPFWILAPRAIGSTGMESTCPDSIIWAAPDGAQPFRARPCPHRRVVVVVAGRDYSQVSSTFTYRPLAGGAIRRLGPHKRVSGAIPRLLWFTVVSPCLPLALPSCQDVPWFLPGNTQPVKPRVRQCRDGWRCVGLDVIATAHACATTALHGTVGWQCACQVSPPQELQSLTGSFFVASDASSLWRDFGQPTGDLELHGGSKTSSAVQAGRCGCG